MKINEVAVREAEPNYEVNPAQARLAAIANKLMDKSATTTDERLGIALSKVATHLGEYGTPFGPKNMGELLDKVNGTGKYAPDDDMPMDDKNPIKVTKETLMKMMDFGQKMVDKEGTVKTDVDVEVTEAETTVKGKPYSAYKAKAQLRELSESRRMLENEIIKLADLDNGDLTDQITTMFNANTKMSGAIRRAYSIIPEDPRDHMNESERSPAMIAKIKKWHDELEDNNHHGEAALLLVNAFGDKQDLDVINAINARHKKRGSIMRSEQQLRDEIASQYYKMLTTNEGVMSDLFKSTTDEKRQKRRTGDMYDQMKVERETKKFEKQGLSPEDARKYAYRKVHGKPVNEVAGPEKCWDGYKKVGTKPGTGKNKGKRVNDCEKA
jgi:hemerythrin superfamily protein